MKKTILFIAWALILGSCSSPKYAYNFDHYDYNSGKKNSISQKIVTSESTTPTSPILIKHEQVVASSTSTPTTFPENTAVVVDKKVIAEKIASLSKAERSQLKKDLRSELNTYKKAKKSGDNIQSVHATNQWDHDLKMAAIFGAIGLVLSLFYGVSPVFWVLGVVAIVIAVVFLIKWLSRQ